jgi:hypothetical protein
MKTHLMLCVLIILSICCCDHPRKTAVVPGQSVAAPTATTMATTTTHPAATDEADALLAQAVALGATIKNDDRWIVMRVLSLNEDDLIKGLSVFLKYSKGKFPSALAGHTMENEMDALTKPLVQSGALKQDDRTKKELSNILFAEMFYDDLRKNKRDVKYYGQNLTVKDQARLLVRWKNDKGTFRAIWSDLHGEDMNADRLAEIERAQASTIQPR